MTATDQKKLVLDAMVGVLKPRGYRRRGSLFLRSTGDVIHLIGLQSSASSTAASAKITVNLAVWLPLLEEEDAKPGIWNAHWQARIGFLLPDRPDRWWTVTSTDETERAALEIAGALERTALPHLETLTTNRAMAELWQSGEGPGLTAFQRARYLEALRSKCA